VDYDSDSTTSSIHDDEDDRDNDEDGGRVQGVQQHQFNWTEGGINTNFEPRHDQFQCVTPK
jgi:hypothetical protein